MSLPVEIRRGVRPLCRLLQKDTFDLRGLDAEAFLPWLEKHLDHWEKDPAFTQRVKIRELRRAHPPLHELEQEQRLALAADVKSPQHFRLVQLEQELTGTGKAITGLTCALAKATGEKRNSLHQKLHSFQIQQQELGKQQTELIQASPARQVLLRVNDQLQQLRCSIGLDQEESNLEKLLKQKGRHSGYTGTSFERLAQTVTRDYIFPNLTKKLTRQSELHLLTGVTLGAARTELDQLVIRPRGPGKSVEVLAAVEVKRNINDLARSFRQRQENLAWLTRNTDRYDPDQYRTGFYTTGHFDRGAVHHQEGETFLLDRHSFRKFRPDPSTGHFFNRLYFITRRKTLWGISAADLGRISHRVATDENWKPDNAVYLSRLWRWCQSLTEPMETPEVLKMYASIPRHARQILLVNG